MAEVKKIPFWGRNKEGCLRTQMEFFCYHSPAFRNFLAEHPFIYFPSMDKASGALFARSGFGEIQKALEILHHSHCKGLGEATLFIFDQAPGEPFGPDIFPSGLRFSVKRAEEVFCPL